MESLSRGEGAAKSIPRREDITPEDCTLALIAIGIIEQDSSVLRERVIDESPISVTLGCRACFAELGLSHFANVSDAPRCQSLFKSEAEQMIIDSAR